MQFSPFGIMTKIGCILKRLYFNEIRGAKRQMQGEAINICSSLELIRFQNSLQIRSVIRLSNRCWSESIAGNQKPVPRPAVVGHLKQAIANPEINLKEIMECECGEPRGDFHQMTCLKTDTLICINLRFNNHPASGKAQSTYYCVRIHSRMDWKSEDD